MSYSRNRLYMTIHTVIYGATTCLQSLSKYRMLACRKTFSCLYGTIKGYGRSWFASVT